MEGLRKIFLQLLGSFSAERQSKQPENIVNNTGLCLKTEYEEEKYEEALEELADCVNCGINARRSWGLLFQFRRGKAG